MAANATYMRMEIDEIRAFMSDFGRRTNQESVMFEFSDGHSAYFLDESEYV